MRLFILLFLLLVRVPVMSQVFDDFTDGNFTSNPTWIGQDSIWRVYLGFLGSNSFTSNNVFGLSTPNAMIQNTEWRWYTRLDFSTSSTNLVDIYLNSDTSNLLSSTRNGYFVRVGNTKDEICLYKVINGVETLLIDGPDAQVPANSEFDIKVTHDTQWKLYTKNVKAGDTYFTLIDSSSDNTINSSSFFGFKIKQSTSSFFAKHYFDNVYVGPILIDTMPPMVSSINVLSGTSIDLILDEANVANLMPSMFNLPGIGHPITASFDINNAALIHLVFSSEFMDGINILEYSGFQDAVGNVTQQEQTSFTYSRPTQYSVLINEVMVDYNPSYGLPDCKYIELYNNSSHDIDISNWLLREDDKYMTIPHYILPKSGYVLLTSSAAQSLKLDTFGDVLFGSYFPSLPVGGATVELFTSDTVFIHGMKYDDNSYQNSVKATGGYSLELIDPNRACESYYNYKASDAAIGGTPASTNSVTGQSVNSHLLEIDFISIIDSSHLQVRMNQYLDKSQLQNMSFTMNAAPTQISDIRTDGSAFAVTLSSPMQDGVIYTASLVGASVCGSVASNLSYSFGLPQNIDTPSLVINEILADSKTGYNDFIEIYNPTDGIYLLSDLVLASRDDMGNIKDVQFITNDYYLMPHSYTVLTDDNAAIMSEIYTVQVPSGVVTLPFSYSLNSTGDVIVITTKTGKVIDEVRYSDKWQFELLNNTKGVSLERISEFAPTQSENNWHSASQNSGYATPTYINSSHQSINQSSSISINHNVISPNGDGKDDYILIEYDTQAPGYLMNASLYDLSGRSVTQIAKGEVLSTSGFIKWEGLDANGILVPPGMYLMWVEIYNTSGKRSKQSFSLNVVQ